MTAVLKRRRASLSETVRSMLWTEPAANEGQSTGPSARRTFAIWSGSKAVRSTMEPPFLFRSVGEAKDRTDSSNCSTGW
jgi:hypothetical protein